MMETISGLFGGFAVAFSGINLLYGFIGCVLGTAVGILPGLGPAATISLLLPAMYGMDSPATALIFLAGIFYGAMYGGSTTSILLKLPGEAASVVSCIDGYEMAKRGRAGAALAIAAIGSFIAGTVGVMGLTFFGPPIASFAIKFSAPEYFALILLGMMLAVFLTGSSPLRGCIMLFAGILLAQVGIDPMTGIYRFTYGSINMMNGFDFVTIAMGMFGLSEILLTLEETIKSELVTNNVGKLWFNAKEWAEAKWAIVRGSLIGFFAGVIPGGGAVISSLVSYSVERKMSKHPEEFGHGAVAGLAGPESANNAASSASFIPLLTLGIPCNASIAMIYAALLIQGITPGPLLLPQHPEVFWGVVASMYLGNVMLVILNLPLVNIWVKLLKVPFAILGPMIVIVTAVGSFSLENSMFSVHCFIVFGIIGYLLRKLDFDPGPLLMAFILTPLLENSMRQSLMLSNGDFSIFVTRPISGTILAIFFVVLIGNVVSAIHKARKNKKSI
ncbi:MAG: tripartite tricarboxylate transporter permease [Candidatus Heteroscillospira sp.]|jgi:putative tricarboxylic transport membrane protein